MVDTVTISGLLSVKFQRLSEDYAAGLALSIIEKRAFELSLSLIELEIGFMFIYDDSLKGFTVVDQHKDAFLNALIDRSGDLLSGNVYTRKAIKGILIGHSSHFMREMYVCIENGAVRWGTVPTALEGYFNPPNDNLICTVKPIYRSLLLRTLRELF